MGEAGWALPGAQGRRAGLWEQWAERSELPVCIQVLGTVYCRQETQACHDDAELGRLSSLAVCQSLCHFPFPVSISLFPAVNEDLPS